jgi:hypothetical protein
VAEVRVEKLMSLSLREFQHSLRPLAGQPVGDITAIDLPLPTGQVTISYEPRPSVRFGGLLDMPRALVSLTFLDAPPKQQAAFLKRFDLAFQRGGG